MKQNEEERFATLAHKQGFKTLKAKEMIELKELAEKKAKETRSLKIPKRR